MPLIRRCLVPLVAVVAVASAGATAVHGACPPPSPDRILLVRHAEAEGTAPEAALTDAGRRRAAGLAEHLAAEPIVAVLATDTRRALDTAAPVAAAHGLEVELYDHRELAGLAEELRGRAGTVLVVGHSNTTPDLVHLLGGDPGEPIAHDEHDRLYRVDVATGATTLDRFAVTPR